MSFSRPLVMRARKTKVAKSKLSTRQIWSRSGNLEIQTGDPGWHNFYVHSRYYIYTSIYLRINIHVYVYTWHNVWGGSTVSPAIQISKKARVLVLPLSAQSWCVKTNFLHWPQVTQSHRKKTVLVRWKTSDTHWRYIIDVQRIRPLGDGQEMMPHWYDLQVVYRWGHPCLTTVASMAPFRNWICAIDIHRHP